MRRHITRSHLIRGLAALALVGVLSTVLPAKDGPPLDGLDAYVTRVLDELEVPGMAVAVVKDGETVVARGFGQRRADEAAPVDEDTRFGIASNSKAFTCAALSILVEEGKIGWDDPVTRHLPELQMHDPWVTRELTVRDLVTHRAGLGLGAGDLMWWPPTDFTRAEILSGVRHLEPASSFRSRYAYNNIMFIAAGEVVARVSEKTWGEFVRERILDPLGMTHTTTSAAALGAGNNATPHVLVGGAPRPIAFMSFGNAAGAVGINSSAAEMVLWMTMLLECSRGEGATEHQACVLKPESIRQMWSPQTIRPTPKMPEPLRSLKGDFAAYGLGVRVQGQRGRKVVTHTGGQPGFLSRVTLVPDERLGIVVLTNQESGPAFDAVTQHILDAWLGPPDPPVDWLEAFSEVAADRRAKAEAKVARDAAARDAMSRPSLPLSGYARVYRDAWYGEVAIAVEGERLVLEMSRTPGMVADLEHWQHDTFVARWRETYMSDRAPYDVYVTFALGADGSVERVGMKPVSPAIDFSFDFQDLRLEPVP